MPSDGQKRIFKSLAVTTATKKDKPALSQNLARAVLDQLKIIYTTSSDFLINAWSSWEEESDSLDLLGLEKIILKNLQSFKNPGSTVSFAVLDPEESSKEGKKKRLKAKMVSVSLHACINFFSFSFFSSLYFIYVLLLFIYCHFLT